MFANLPKSALDALNWQWADFAPYAEALAAREITPATLETFMQDWTAVSKVLQEVGSRLYVNFTLHTDDETAKKQYLDFAAQVYPEAAKMNNVLNKKLVESGLTPANFDVPLRALRAEIEIFREENLPLFTELTELSTQYDELIGAQTVQWEGDEKTIAQMRPVFQQPDRTQRETAFTLIHQRRLQDRQALNDLWVKMFTIRQRIAQNAGFDNFLDFTWQNYGRFDYRPQDTHRFHAAIEQIVVPAAKRVFERKRQALGLATLREWDVDAVPPTQQPLRPFQTGDELASGSSHIFNRVDPELGAYFQTMRDEKLLDLENYKGKAPGGYCTAFSVVDRPFIFMNSVGLHDDLQTMLHEAGHAFHVFEAAALPYVQQKGAPIEFCEVASMSMELLAAPYMTKQYGGFYQASEAARARIEHLEGMLTFWPYMAVVDAFQQWAYTSGDAALDPRNCDAKWTELWQRFKQGIDYSGQQDWVETGWHRKLHIYTVPLYYIEYGIAQLGAAQVWANSLKDQAQALKAYRHGLALGNTAKLPDLFAAAGAKLAFDVETLGEMVELIEATIDELTPQAHAEQN
jgi:oligoendopeptidase F